MFRLFTIIGVFFLGMMATSAVSQVFVEDEAVTGVGAETSLEENNTSGLNKDSETNINGDEEVRVEEVENGIAPGTVEKTDKNYPNLYRVVEVVDGDTIKLDIEGKVETVRLIGLDTPETVHPSEPVECFGLEASNKAKSILRGQTVAFETDLTQGARDKYGRLLGYIVLPDGTNYNQLMIKEGYGHEYTYAVPYKYQVEFKAAEEYARQNKLGLWADGVCANDVASIPPGSAYSTNASVGGNWYVSSHHSSRYYYCEESSVWQGLSQKYLRVYKSKTDLLKDFPNHILHHSCDR